MLILIAIFLIWVGLAIFIKYYERKEVMYKIKEIITVSPGSLVDSRGRAEDYMSGILKPAYNILNCEVLVIIYLNEADKIITTDIRMGGRNAVLYSIDEIAGGAVGKEAVKVILGHSHAGNYNAPGGHDISDCASLYLSLSSKKIQLMGDFLACRSGVKSIMDTLQFKEMTEGR